MSILSNSNVTNSTLKDEDNFLSLTSFTEIMNGSLDSNFLIDVIGQPIDIGDIQVVPVQGKETEKLEFTLTDTEDHQIACCLWGRFAELMLYAYKVAQVNKNFLCLLRFAKINVYKGQVQITNAFDSSTIGDLMSKTIYKCTTSLLSQLVVMSLQNIKEANANLINALSDRSSGQVSLVSMESEENTCLSSTPLSKRKGECEIDDLSSTSKKQCSKIMKQEKNPSMNRMKRKHQPRFEDDGHRLRSQSISKQRIDHSQRKDVPLSTVFRRLMSDITNNNVSSRFKTQVSVSNPTNKRGVLYSLLTIVYIPVCFDKKNNENPNDTKKSRRDQGSCSSQGTFQRENTPNTKIPMTSTSHTTFDSGISNTSYIDHDCSIDDPKNEDLLRSIDECDDLEVECSSQESSDTEISDDEQSIVQEPLKEDQTERVSFLAALFKKNFSEVKKPVKPKVKAVSSSEY
ncbi:hypothetical protein HID58_060539, partial [Brassica napus]